MQATLPLDCTNTLTNRQYKVLAFYAEELTKQQIGDKFYLTEAWANKELRIIYKKLGVHTQQGAVDKAWKLGIFTIEGRNKKDVEV
ncbi:MAG: helix-turn-helix transcriptional regulator [Bacteroidia bacterium]